MKNRLALGLGFSLAIVDVLLMPSPVSAQLPFETCLRTAEKLFREGSQSELVAIQTCRGTTDRGDVTECLELVDDLWRDGTVSERLGLESCQVARRLFSDSDSDTSDLGAYASCLTRAENSTRDYTPEEMTSIQSCRGLTYPEEVAPCFRLVEDLWRDGSEAELAGLSACQVSLY